MHIQELVTYSSFQRDGQDPALRSVSETLLSLASQRRRDLEISSIINQLMLLHLLLWMLLTQLGHMCILMQMAYLDPLVSLPGPFVGGSGLGEPLLVILSGAANFNSWKGTWDVANFSLQMV